MLTGWLVLTAGWEIMAPARRDALFSVLLSVSVALMVGGAVRVLLQGARWIAG